MRLIFGAIRLTELFLQLEKMSNVFSLDWRQLAETWSNSKYVPYFWDLRNLKNANEYGHEWWPKFHYSLGTTDRVEKKKQDILVELWKNSGHLSNMKYFVESQIYGMLTIQIKETQGRKWQVIQFKVYSPCSLYNIL